MPLLRLSDIVESPLVPQAVRSIMAHVAQVDKASFIFYAESHNSTEMIANFYQ